MKQLLTENKVYLLDYTNNINFPSYEQTRKAPLLVQNNIIDSLNNYNLQSGLLNLEQNILHLNNIYFIELISITPFHIFIDDNFLFTTYSFSYKNLTNPLSKLSILNYQMNPNDLDTLPDNLMNIAINYVLLNE